MNSVTFVTCVASAAKYVECRKSIERLDAPATDVALEPIDNAGNRYTCASALNRGWDKAGTDWVVFCHEDVVFPEDWLGRLTVALGAVALGEGQLGVFGPMGRTGKRFYGHAFDQNGEPTYRGPLPTQVETLDEFCVIVPRRLPLRFDEQLGGYHLYAVDLCIQAVEATYACYAIDAPCRHNSETRHRPPDYHVIKRRLQRKWMFRRRRVGRTVGTTCGRIRFGIFEGWI